MYPAACIAHEFVKLGMAEKRLVTQMKLQKLVFFAHGYHLAKYKEPLIQERFEAWKFGPVVPDIYQAFKSFGNEPITDVSKVKYGVPVDQYKIDLKARDAVNYTWTLTSKLTAFALSNWTLEDGSPWSLAYNPNDWAIPIDNESIKKYFSKLLSNSNARRTAAVE